MKTKHFLLSLIFLLGFFLRTYRLDTRPLGFTWDEAALGYNAYSLLQTGKDEHAKILPIIFESFSDYKPGLYIYFTVPSIAIFGLNEFATRLPSAIFGSLSVLLVYILVRHLFASPLSWSKRGVGGELSGLTCAFMLAINPWSLHFSRGAWEANLALFLLLLGAVLFVAKKLSLSALFFGLTFITYQGSKLFTPLLVASLLLVWSQTKKVQFILIMLIFTLPIIFGGASQLGRLKVSSVFSYRRPQQVIQNLLTQDNTSKLNFTYYLFHSELLDQTRGIIQRYLNHFSPRFLFFEGDWSNLRHSTTYQGYLFLPEIFTFLVGITYLIKHPSRFSYFIFLWLALAPVPSALSRDIVSGVRSLPMVIPLIIISGIGLSKMLLYSPALLLFIALYLDLYYIHTPVYTAADWLYAYKPAMEVVAQNYSSFDRIIISDKLGQPYIFTLFHLAIPTKLYQTNATIEKNAQGDVSKVTAFPPFEFRPIFFPSDRELPRTLLVGDQYELPLPDLEAAPNVDTIWQTAYPGGKPALTIVSLK